MQLKTCTLLVKNSKKYLKSEKELNIINCKLYELTNKNY